MAMNAGHDSAAFALEIDGKPAGSLNTFEGGGAFAEVIETPDTGGPPDKSIGNAQYDDIVVTCPFPDGTLATWVTAFLEGKAPEHDSAVILLNRNWQPLRRLPVAEGRDLLRCLPWARCQRGQTGGTVDDHYPADNDQ